MHTTQTDSLGLQQKNTKMFLYCTFGTVATNQTVLGVLVVSTTVRKAAWPVQKTKKHKNDLNIAISPSKSCTACVLIVS